MIKENPGFTTKIFVDYFLLSTLSTSSVEALLSAVCVLLQNSVKSPTRW